MRATRTVTNQHAAVARARIRLRQAIDRACIARGEAQWTNGFRTGRGGTDAEDDQLSHKQKAQFAFCAKEERAAERAMRAYGRAMREFSPKPTLTRAKA